MDLLRFPPFLLLLCLVPALLAWKFMDRSSRPPVLIYALRWFLGLTFTFSGLAKLIPGFPNTIGPVNLESALAPHGLGLFARFIAVSELAVGLLLLTRRFATLGALMLFPMLASILVVTISLGWRGTPRCPRSWRTPPTSSGWPASVACSSRLESCGSISRTPSASLS